MKYILSPLSFIILLISSISAQYKVLKPQELVIQAKKDAIPVNFDFFKLNLQNTKPANNDIRTCTILELNEKKFKNPMIIFISEEKISDLERAEGLERGADGYLTKSVNSRGFLAQINALVRLKNAQDKLEQVIKEKEELIEQLHKAIENIETLQGLIPVCSFCKKIRTDKGIWEKMEDYVCRHSNVEFSHGLCESCFKEHYPETYRKKLSKEKKEKKNDE